MEPVLEVSYLRNESVIRWSCTHATINSSKRITFVPPVPGAPNRLTNASTIGGDRRYEKLGVKPLEACTPLLDVSHKANKLLKVDSVGAVDIKQTDHELACLGFEVGLVARRECLLEFLSIDLPRAILVHGLEEIPHGRIGTRWRPIHILRGLTKCAGRASTLSTLGRLLAISTILLRLLTILRGAVLLLARIALLRGLLLLVLIGATGGLCAPLGTVAGIRVCLALLRRRLLSSGLSRLPLVTTVRSTLCGWLLSSGLSRLPLVTAIRPTLCGWLLSVRLLSPVGSLLVLAGARWTLSVVRHSQQNTNLTLCCPMYSALI
eukprot:Opistho-2@49263